MRTATTSEPISIKLVELGASAALGSIALPATTLSDGAGADKMDMGCLMAGSNSVRGDSPGAEYGVSCVLDSMEIMSCDWSASVASS